LSKVQEAFEIAASGKALKVIVGPEDFPEAAGPGRSTAVSLEDRLADAGVSAPVKR
jgi:hypothetical protein